MVRQYRYIAIVLLAASGSGCVHSAAEVGCKYPEGGRRRVAAPELVAELSGTTDVVVTKERLCGLLPDGRVRCLGATGKESACAEGEPPSVAEVRDAVALFEDCARLRDGSVRCWGAKAPVAADVPPVKGVVRQMARGCAVVDPGGTVQCWGERPGLGQVQILAGVEEIGFTWEVNAGCARAAGRVFCWNDSELVPVHPAPVPLEMAAPQRVQGLRDVTQLAVGAGFACALTHGEVVCWGVNGAGQLGDGTHDDRLVPRAIPGLRGVVEVVAGDGRACARTEDGRVACWGALFGAGGPRERLAPEWVEGLSGVRRIAAGPATLCAIDQRGQVRCWGELLVAPQRLTSSAAIPAPSVAPVVVTSRPPPAPGRMACSDQESHHLEIDGTTTMFPSDEECLDWRASTKAQATGRCRRVTHRWLKHSRADGTQDWACECIEGKCRSTDAPVASASCGEDPDTGAPLTPPAQAALCRDLPRATPATGKSRVRYCANGAQPVVGDCHPPPGGGSCEGPRSWIPSWRCFPTARDCDENLRQGRKAGLPSVDAACTVVVP